MEAAPCTVKRLLGNESGNFLAVFSILLLIAGAVSYFTSVSDMVDKEVRDLGATQKTVFMKSDFKETIRKSLLKQNTKCSEGVENKLWKLFIDFRTDGADAAATFNFTKADDIKKHKDARCFFNPARYSGINFENLQVRFYRPTEPNFLTLSSIVNAEVNVGILAGGKKSQLKYLLRYRIDVFTLNHMGIIFDANDSGSQFITTKGSEVNVHSPVLVDQSKRNRQLPLGRLMDGENLRYFGKVSIAAPGLKTDEKSFEFLKTRRLTDLFAQGVHFGVLPLGVESPYQTLPEKWKDVFNYDFMDKAYMLPELKTKEAGISSPMGIIYKFSTREDGTPYNKTIHNNTAEIYKGLSGSAKDLYRSCGASNLSAGQFNLFIFNNLDQVLTIDFTENVDLATPPVFCGVIAAKKVRFILNQGKNPATFRHYFVGKIITREGISVEENGSLHLHDIMEVTSDKVPYSFPDIDWSNLKIQFYNQKYYATQNFTIPYFKTTPALSVADQFYLPRATADFFNTPCTGAPNYLCRKDELEVPDLKDLINRHQDKLIYEVTHAE